MVKCKSVVIYLDTCVCLHVTDQADVGATEREMAGNADNLDKSPGLAFTVYVLTSIVLL